jgi:GAG-pre-integrase domain
MNEKDPDVLFLQLELKRRELDKFGEKVNDLTMKTIIMKVLPNLYDPVKATIASSAHISYEQVKEHIRSFYNIKKHAVDSDMVNDSNTVMFQKQHKHHNKQKHHSNKSAKQPQNSAKQQQSNSGTGQNDSGGKKGLKWCHICNMDNHWTSKCGFNERNPDRFKLRRKPHYNNGDTSDTTSNTSHSSNSGSYSTTRCNNCGRNNHTTEQCYRKPQNTVTARNIPIQEETAEVLLMRNDVKFYDGNLIGGTILSNTIQSSSDFPFDKWCLDTGAGFHCTHDDSELVNMRPSSGYVLGIGGFTMPIKGIGDLHCTIKQSNGKPKAVIIKDIRYVPKLKGKLLSQYQFIKSGYGLLIDEDIGYIKKGDTKYNVVNIGTHYFLDVLEVKQINVMNLQISDQLNLLHRRLGHINMNILKLLAKDSDDDDVDDDIFTKQIQTEVPHTKCEVCETCKHTKPSYTRRTTKQSTRPFELIYTDVLGPIEPASINGNKYAILIIDDYTRYSYIDFMKNKSEVPAKLNKFFTQEVLSRYGNNNVMRSDNAKRVHKHRYAKSMCCNIKSLCKTQVLTHHSRIV